MWQRVHTKETVFKRLKVFNCELLSRPKIGVSELAASIDSPLQAVSDGNSSLVNVEGIKKLQEKLSPLSKALEPLNSLNKMVPTTGNVKEMLRFFLTDDPEVEKLVGGILGWLQPLHHGDEFSGRQEPFPKSREICGVSQWGKRCRDALPKGFNREGVEIFFYRFLRFWCWCG